eukprot:CAMPEP_0115582518 /NCGR_PEP_ID=MMETSP0272-20121206/5702_1 /TAXON_ID=71861 /ORGANISM="Scrippsiella trochoidea, Strain CCMP3099" /LENGTH=65 /DNA_ID=CAMNT_0003017509 /DNA_START=272 /DNA_END=466 /DNA_ORIENTATION=+
MSWTALNSGHHVASRLDAGFSDALSCVLAHVAEASSKMDTVRLTHESSDGIHYDPPGDQDQSSPV